MKKRNKSSFALHFTYMLVFKHCRRKSQCCESILSRSACMLCSAYNSIKMLGWWHSMTSRCRITIELTRGQRNLNTCNSGAHWRRHYSHIGQYATELRSVGGAYTLRTRSIVGCLLVAPPIWQPDGVL